jgi:hypothetical protein
MVQRSVFRLLDTGKVISVKIAHFSQNSEFNSKTCRLLVVAESAGLKLSAR